MNIKYLTIATIIIFTLVILFRSTNSTSKYEVLKPEALILAFGDSLTAGKGAIEKKSYPAQLEQLSGYKVINAGVSGELSADGLTRLPKLLQEHRPKLVILCHGGNDFIRNRPIEQLKSNLKMMITISQNSGAKVLFIAEPSFGMLGFSPHRLYREISEEFEVIFEEDVVSDVLNSSSLKSDNIHPNSRGYAIMAQAFYESLQDEGLLP